MSKIFTVLKRIHFCGSVRNFSLGAFELLEKENSQ